MGKQPPQEDADHSGPPWLLVLAISWGAIATLLFYTSSLPNSTTFDTRTTYWLLWPEVASAAMQWGSGSSLLSLLERLPYWGVATVMVVSAVSTGDLLLRRLCCSDNVSSAIRLGLAGGLGLSAISLVTLCLGVCGLLRSWVFWPVLLAPIAYSWHAFRGDIGREVSQLTRWRPRGVVLLLLAVAMPFAIVIVLGASLPSVDFDVREYHLQGPKEFYLNGRVGFLEYNVYTSFPFLTEMLSLCGMVLVGGWWGGAIVGKVVLASFAGFVVLLLVGLGREIDDRAGALAAFFWITSPWCYRASTIAYTEGALSYYVLAVLTTAWLAWKRDDAHWWGITGLLAGSAMSCKYPGLVQAVVPAALVGVAYLLRRKHGDNETVSTRWVAAAWFTLGTFVAFGPWALKNLLETGNPVYPLGYSVFGGVDLSDAWAAKWAGGHSPPFKVWTDPVRALPDFIRSLADVFVKNDWQTPLVISFAPLSLLVLWKERSQLLIGVLAFALWLFVMWWAVTHRIDRFWVPMLPVVCFLAGIGFRWPTLIGEESSRPAWRWFGGAIIAVSLLFHGPFIAIGQAGYQHWLAPYDVAVREAASSSPSIALLNEQLPANARPLLVGEAQVFELKVRPVYNTVFDDSVFQMLTSADRSLPDAEQPTAEADQICENLAKAGVTHLFVNWSEVLRYRETYGYTDYVSPQRIVALVEAGVLEPMPVEPTKMHVLWEDLNESTREEIRRWGPQLKVQLNGHEAFHRFELFEIVCSKRMKDGS